MGFVSSDELLITWGSSVLTNSWLHAVFVNSMYYVERQSEVVRENGSHRTVWNQCCLSPWVGQTQKSSESEMSWWIPRRWMQASGLPPPWGAGLRPAFISSEFTMTCLTPWISDCDPPKDFGNIGSTLSLGFRFPWRLPPLSPRHYQTVTLWEGRSGFTVTVGEKTEISQVILYKVWCQILMGVWW